MIANLTELALMSAVLLFVISLPLGQADAAKSLRRAAGFAFAMAFVPATLYSIASPLLRHRFHAPVANAELVLAGVGVLAIFIVLSLAVYGFLDFRAHTKSRQPKPHGESHYVKRHHVERPPDDEEHE